MASRKGNFLRGVIGKVVLKVRDGKQIASQRVAPGTIKHTEATKKSNQTFGMASSLAAQIRRTIADKVAGVSDLTMASRLCGHCFTILTARRNRETREYQFEVDSFKLLEGFVFDRAYPMTKRINQMPTITREAEILTVAFPEINVPEILKFPYNSYRCKITVSVSLFRLGEGQMVERCQSQEIVILKDLAPINKFEFTYTVPDGCLYVVCMYLEYATRKSSGSKVENQPKLNSACICEARITEGKYGDNANMKWIEMRKY